MLIHSGKKLGFRTTHVCWPSDAASILSMLSDFLIVRIMYADELFKKEVEHLSPYTKEQFTITLDLNKTEDLLLSETDAKSCRYEIRKADKLGFRVSINEPTEEAFQLFQNFFASNGYRSPMTRMEWQGYLQVADLHTIYHDHDLIAAHLLLRDAPHRVRLLLSATAERKQGSLNPLIGPLNRRLHWAEILHYKHHGFEEYDFGGVIIEPSNPLYSITKFKQSFGGRLDKHFNLVIIRNPILRMAANGYMALKNLTKKNRS